MTNNDPQAWSPYWQSATITSFGELFPDNYDDSILEFWKSQLTGRFNRVLDLACGNGALTWICNAILNTDGAQSRITGVDFADIDPYSALGRDPSDYPGVDFVGNTPIESLPFPDSSVDLVVSQYGLEYSNLEKTIPEVARILSPEGKICLIMHDAQSVLIKGATEHLEDFRRIFSTIRMHDLALELDRLHYAYDSPQLLRASDDFGKLDERIRRSTQEIDSMLRTHPANSPAVLYIQRLNAAFEKGSPYRSDERRSNIELARDSLGAHIGRIDELRNAALSDRDRERLVSMLHARNLDVVENRIVAYKEHPNVGTAMVAIGRSGRDGA